MASKINAQQMADGQWKILSTDKDGNEKTQDTIAEIDAMPDGEALQVFQGLVSQAPNKRRAAVSMLVSILRLSYAKLDEFKGSGDPESGQLSNALREQFRKAEDAYFDQFMEKEHPFHDKFIKRLPAVNERGDSLDGKDGKPNWSERFAYFVTTLRKDPSYGQAKNMVLNFWHFVGQDPFHEDKNGLHILPPEVMRVMVNNAKDVKPRDTSWAATFIGMSRDFVNPVDEKHRVFVDDARLDDCIVAAKDILAELERQKKLAEARAVKQAKPGDVVEQTKEAIASANAKRTGEPTAAAKKATAHH